MMMDVGMDTGDMLEKLAVPVEAKETYGSIHDKLSILGGDLILSTLEKLKQGTLERIPQPEDEATYTKKITKSMGDIDWAAEAAVIERYIRGLNPMAKCLHQLEWKNIKNLGCRCAGTRIFR